MGLLFLILSFGNSHAQIQKSGLFLGNSYTYANDLPLMIHKIAYSKGNAFVYSSHTPGGYLLGSHAIHEVSLAKIDTENFDYLILQEQSIALANSARGYAKYFHRSIEAAEFLHHRSQLIDSCRQTLLYLTWGRKEGHGIYGFPFNYGENYNGMQDNLTENYSQTANIIGAQISPVGEVWRIIVNEHPSVNLYTADGSHPNSIGTYLAACVFYQSMFKDGIQNVWRPHTVADSVAQFIHDAVDKVITQNWSRWNNSALETACNPGGIKHNTNDWSDTLIAPYTTLSKIHFYDAQHGYLKGNKETLKFTQDGGENWNDLALPASNPVSPNYENSFAIHFSNPDTIWYAVGTDEIDSSTLVFTGISGNKGAFNSYLRVFRSTNGGDSWEERSPEKLDYQQLDSGLLYQRPTFSDMTIYFEDHLRGTLFASYSGRDTLIYSYWTDDGGLSWNRNISTVGRTTSEFWMQGLNEAYKSGFKDTNDYVNAPLKLYKTEDRGMSWNEVASFPDSCCKPAYYNIPHQISSFSKIGDTLLASNSLFAPEIYQSVDGGEEWKVLSKISITRNLEDIVKLPNGVYLLPVEGRFGRIFASYDFGNSWELEAYFPFSIRSISYTDKHVYAVDSWGSMYKKDIDLIESRQNLTSSTFDLFPNPTQGKVEIFGAPSNSSIHIYSSNGNLVQTIESDSNGNAVTNLSRISSGLYFLQIEKDGIPYRKKLVVMN